MSGRGSRRRLLRATAGIAAALGTGGFAGCSSPSFLRGGDERSDARDWLYDPTTFADDPIVTFRYESPRGIDAAREHLHPEVRTRHATPAYADVLDPAETEWAVAVTEDLFKAPFQYAYGGSFDEAAAERAAAAPFAEDVVSVPDGEIEGLQRLSLGRDAHGAYREGLAVGVANATSDAFETLIADAAGRTDRLVDVAPDVASYLDALGFDHTAQATLAPGTESNAWRGAGTGYRIDGETTRIRWVTMNRGDPGEAALRDRAGDVDGLRDVSVASDGPVRWIEGVADTDRVGLRGQLFPVGELPYE